MALSAMEKSLCNKLVSDYYKLVAPIKAARGALRKAAQDLDAFLRSMTFSPLQDLEDALNGFVDNIKGMLPNDDIDSIDQLLDFIRNCPYLAGYAPTSSLKGLIDGIFDNIQGLIDGLTSLFPEFGAGNIASYINGLLSGLAFPGGDLLSDLLKQIAQLIECLSALCAAVDLHYVGGLTAITDDFNSLLEDLNLIGDVPVSDPNFGKFDYNTLYTAVGLTPDQIGAINNTSGTIDDQKAGAVDAIKKSVDAVKSFTKNFGG